VARASPDNSDLRFCGGESGTGNVIEDWSMSSLKRGECVVAPSEGLPTHRQDAVMATKPRPKLRPVGQVISCLTWDFAVPAGWCSGYFKVSGTGAPIRSKASRWALVGSASIGMVAWVPAKRTWLRVKVARCSRRPRKL
jgi:hypothetical protein